MQSATLNFIVKEAKIRIFWMTFCFFLTSTTCYWFSHDLFFALSTPFIKVSKNSFFLCTQITESLNTYITISIFLGFFFSIPYILYQFWCFFIPSYNNIQRKSILQIISLAVIALFLSLLLTYTIVLPNLWFFLYNLNNTGHLGYSSSKFFTIQLQPKIYDFSLLTLRILSIAALCSQIPLTLIYSIQHKIVNIEIIIKKRRSFAFFSILFAALITPPDVWCQLLVCFFIYILIELAVFCAIVQEQYSTFLSKK